MKAIAVTLGAAGRRDFFWLNGNFGMMASSPLRGLGFNLHFGGIFTSAPAAVASMMRRPLVVSGDFDVGGFDRSGGGSAPAGFSPVGDIGGAELSADPDPGTLSREHMPLDDIVGGGLAKVQRIDLFGLGLDYAMYHRVLWGAVDTDQPGSWHRLDGVFTSSPSAIAWKGNRIDVFGLGMDHALYTKSCVGEAWSPDWQRLGGTFTSTASLVSRSATQLDLFIRGADYTLRGNQTDGTSWFGWQNHGGNLASPPVAVSWGPDRIDVFAIFKDGALWHHWWDGQIWNEWESLGGKYTGEPAAVCWGPGRIDVFAVGAEGRGLHHHWFSNDTWSFPEVLGIGTSEGMAESPTVVSAADNRLEVFVPTNGKQIRIVTWDGQSWQSGATGASFRMPSRYRFSVDRVKASTTRALNADTDAAAASVTAGNAAVRTNTQWIGEIGGLGSPKTSQTNLLDFEPVTVELAEPMSFSYIVVNNGHSPQDKILAALANASDSLSLAGSSSMQEDIGKGIAQFISVKIVAALSLSIPVLGPILALIETWLLSKLTEAIFESCDGLVAVEMRAMMGRDLFIMTENGTKTVTVTTTHPGTNSPTTCRAESEYDVTWTIQPL